MTVENGYLKDSDVGECKNTSYDTSGPDRDETEGGCRIVTLRIGPTAERIQTDRGPCSQKAIIFAAMSWKQRHPVRKICNKTKHCDCDK